MEGGHPHSLPISAASLVIQVAATLLRAAVTLRRSYNLQQLHRRRPLGPLLPSRKTTSMPSARCRASLRGSTSSPRRSGITPSAPSGGGLLTAIGYAIMAMVMLAEWTTCGGRLIAIDWSTLSWIPGMCARLLFIFDGKENDSLGGGK